MESGKIHSKDSSQSIPPSIKWSRPLNYTVSLPALILLFSFWISSLAAPLLLTSKAFAIEPPFELPPASEILKIRSAIITTAKGRMAFELYPEEAPWHVSNFKFLADNGFYRGKSFHILIEDFIIQGGRNSKPEFNYVLPAEFSARKHEFGTLGMARPPDYMNPRRSSSSTQFHILLRNAPNMDGSYSIFGKLIEGTDVLESLAANDRINDVMVFMENSSELSSSPEAPTQTPNKEKNSFYIEPRFIDQWAIPASTTLARSSDDSYTSTN